MARSSWMVGGLLLAAGVFMAVPSIAQDWQPNPSRGPAIDKGTKTTTPIDVEGCWQGTLGSGKEAGTGFLDISQDGATLSAEGEIDVPSKDLDTGGSLSGTATDKKFTVGFAESGCKVSFTGKLSTSGSDLIGTYHYSCDKVHAGGAIDFAADPSGCGG
jgi:hypothetical protein